LARLADGRFLCASVPFKAAAMETDGEEGLKEGGTKRRRGWDEYLSSRLWGRRRVGERPAAAGAERGVVEVGLVRDSSRGVAVCADTVEVGVYVFVLETT